MMNLEKYTFKQGTYKDKNVIWIDFPYSATLKKDLKRCFPLARWSTTNKMWYLPDLPSVRSVLNIKQREEVGDSNKSKILPVNQKALNSFINQLKLKAYSRNTIRIYVAEFTHLLELLKNKHVNELTPEELKSYFLYCINSLGMKEAKMNGKINAIKFYFEQVMHRDKMFFAIPRPKKPQVSPKVLSKREIKKIFNQIENRKHLLMLQLCYGMGLRVSEVVNLKINHIDSSRMQVLIAGAKGKKDRYVNLPDSVLELLQEYYLEFKPKDWLFEGKNGGQYSVRSVQAVLKKAMKKANIHKQIGIHGLRPSYATDLLASGVDLQFIEELLGNKNIKTK